MFRIGDEKSIYMQARMMRILHQRFKFQVYTIKFSQEHVSVLIPWELASEFFFSALSEPEAGSGLVKPTALKISRLLGELGELMQKNPVEFDLVSRNGT